MNRIIAAVTVCSVLSLAALGCSPKASESAAVPGVGKETISLAVLTDLSGAFAAGGKATLRGLQLHWEEVNNNGGVCGRTVELKVQDHNYNTQTAVSLYTEMEPDVLALQMLLGSPMVTALRPSVDSDQVFTIPSSFDETLLNSPSIALTGTTYQQEMSNAAQWLAKTGKLDGGKQIGHIYLEGEYGESALAGSSEAAQKLGLEKVAAQVVKPSDKDMTGPVSALQQGGVDYIMLTTTPTQTASALSVAKSRGYNVDFIGSTFTFVPSLLEGGAKGPLTEHFYQTSAFAPLSSAEEGPTGIRKAFQKQWPDQEADPPVVHGGAAAAVMYEVLAATCAKGELTRQAVLNTYRDLAKVDTAGLLPTLDYTTRGKPPTDDSYLLRPDPDAPGGLELVHRMHPDPEVPGGLTLEP